MDGTHTLDLLRSREQCEAMASSLRSARLHADVAYMWWFAACSL